MDQYSHELRISANDFAVEKATEFLTSSAALNKAEQQVDKDNTTSSSSTNKLSGEASQLSACCQKSMQVSKNAQSTGASSGQSAAAPQ